MNLAVSLTWLIFLFLNSLNWYQIITSSSLRFIAVQTSHKKLGKTEYGSLVQILA